MLAPCSFNEENCMMYLFCVGGAISIEGIEDDTSGSASEVIQARRHVEVDLLEMYALAASHLLPLIV